LDPLEVLVNVPPGKARRNALPAHIRSLFWDYDAAHLDWRTDRDLIMARILASGDWDAVRWLLRREGPELLRDWLRARRGRGLDARRLRFWELVLGLPRREVNQWLQASAGDGWPSRAAR